MAGNFQQMGNAGGNQMMMQQQSQAASQVQQNAIQNVLLQNIQSQPGVLSGWQANIPVNDRLGQVWHIVTQLRLANSNSNSNTGQQDLQKICGLALNFEKGAFDSASDRDSYLKLLHDKLEQLTAARNHQMSMNAQAALQAQAQAQAHAQQMGMVNQGGMPGQMARPNMGQPQPQQGFQHLQHQMQATPLPGQQHPQQVAMGMGNNMLAQNVAQGQQQFQMSTQQQQQQQPQQPQQQQQPGINNRPQGGQAQMTPQEQAMVVELTNRLMAAASEEDKNNVRITMQGRMDQATLMRYQTQGLDPLMLYYRNVAMNRLRQEKQRHALANQQPGQGMPMGVKRPQGAVPMQQQRSGNPNPMAGQGQQPQQQQMLGNPDFGFVGAVDGTQQQNGTLPQEAGQMGVPPNLPQGNTTPQTIAGLPAQAVTPNTQRVAQNPNLRIQQQVTLQRAQQELVNQATTQAQAQARAKAQAQQMALHGQPGGMGPMPPAQSPAMNTLNAPLSRAPQENPAGDVLQINQQGASHFGQPLDPRFAALNQRAGMNGGQNNIMFPPGMTPEQRQRLMTLPADKLNEVIGKWNERVINPGQQIRPTGPMPGNGQMVRPNQAIPPAALNQQNMTNQMAAQFMPNGQPIQRPPQSMMAGMNPQQQMLLQQQMANRMAQQGQGRNMPQGPMGAADLTAINQIDHVDFPPQVVNTIPRQVPQEIKKWGQLKAWVAQNLGNMPQILEQLKHMQRMQYQTMLRQRMTQRMQQQNGTFNQPGGQPQVPGVMNPAMAAPVAPMGQPQLQQPAQMPMNMANIPQVSPQDIQKARAHPSGRWAAMSDDEIKTMIIKNTLMQRQRQNLAQFQQQQQQMNQMGQMGLQAGPQNAMQRPGIQQPQPQPGPAPGGKMGRAQPGQPVVPQARPQQPPTAVDLKQPPTAPTRASKPGQTTSSPAQPPKNLKRASSDEVIEVPNPNVTQQNRLSMQQQLSQQQRPGIPQPPRPNLTPEQINALTPDQKKQYFEALRRFQQSKQQQQVGPQPTPEDMHKFQSIRKDEISKFRPLPDIPMDQETKQAVANKLINTAPKLNNVFKVAPRWFVISHDENRLRLFFRTQIRVSQQFEDQAMLKTKQSFSMGLKDVDEALNIAQNMIADVLAKYPNLSRSQGAPGPVGGQPQAAGVVPQPLPQTMPLNAANLQQQQQALAKQQQSKLHVRSNSKSHPPAAPTTAQPPFAISSPQGIPMYGQPQIDPGQLRIPPAKKRKNATTTPVLPPKAAPPAQAPLAGPPEMRHDQQGQVVEVKQGPKVWTCPEVDCDHYYNDPFASEQELAKHKLEEHIKPLQDPAKFMMSELAQMLGLEEDGTEKKAEKPDTAADAQAAKIESQGQALAAIPMKTQPSSTGKPSPAVSTKQAKPAEGKPAVRAAKQVADLKEGQPPAPKIEQVTPDPWANSSVNPQDLVHNFQKFETGAGGAISNMDVYRSITPNDTPESSKDGLSEPNSDITEGVDLNIDLQFGEFDRNWMPFGPSDADDLLGFGDITVSGGADDAVMVDTDALPSNEAWDQFIDFSAPDKPFAFDTTFFSMNEQDLQ